jgi:hypothetical protein
VCRDLSAGGADANLPSRFDLAPHRLIRRRAASGFRLAIHVCSLTFVKELLRAILSFVAVFPAANLMRVLAHGLPLHKA